MLLIYGLNGKSRGLRPSCCWRSLGSWEPLTCLASLLPAHQQGDECSTQLSSELYYGNGHQEEFSTPVAIMRLRMICLWVIRNIHAGPQASPTGIYRWSGHCSRTRDCTTTSSKDSTGLPGAATAAPRIAQEEELALSIGHFQQRLRKDKVEEMRYVSFAVLPANVTKKQVTFLLILLWLAGA